MFFKEAYEALKQGADIKRPSWKGFWRKEEGTIVMYCKDGSKVPFMETECIFVDIDHMMADDWEIVDGDSITGLDVSTFSFGEGRNIRFLPSLFCSYRNILYLCDLISYLYP